MIVIKGRKLQIIAIIIEIKKWKLLVLKNGVWESLI